jgi:hypothetical protein
MSGMPRRRVKAAPQWFGKLFRFLVFAPLPLLLVFGPSVPRSIRGLPLEVTGQIRGVAGARVRVPGDPVRYETLTNEDGVFRFHLPALGSGREPDSAWYDGYRFGVEAEGMLRVEEAFCLEHPLPDPFPVHLGPLRLSRVAAEVCGTVSGLDGRPVSGAVVSCAGREAVTDREGRFGPLPTPAGFWSITAKAPGVSGSITALLFPFCPGTE